MSEWPLGLALGLIGRRSQLGGGANFWLGGLGDAISFAARINFLIIELVYSHSSTFFFPQTLN